MALLAATYAALDSSSSERSLHTDKLGGLLATFWLWRRFLHPFVHVHMTGWVWQVYIEVLARYHDIRLSFRMVTCFRHISMISHSFCIARYPHRVIASFQSTTFEKRGVAVVAYVTCSVVHLCRYWMFPVAASSRQRASPGALEVPSAFPNPFLPAFFDWSNSLNNPFRIFGNPTGQLPRRLDLPRWRPQRVQSPL